MKLLFFGSAGCNGNTLKHLLLIAEEIAFLNRPSITFHNWGTVAVDSPFKNVDSSDSPVAIKTFPPPIWACKCSLF
jgi:hypothetical protein